MQRAAFSAGLLANGEQWMRMIARRNQTTHTYNEETVEAICEAIVEAHTPTLERAYERLCALEKKSGL